MDSFKAQGFLETDPSRFGRLDEAKILYEENPLLIDCLRIDPLQFACKCVGDRISKIDRQSSSADGGPIVETAPHPAHATREAAFFFADQRPNQ